MPHAALLLITALLTLSPNLAAAKNKAQALHQEWSSVMYGNESREAKLAAFETLQEKSAKAMAAQPTNDELKLWHAIILSTYAGELNNSDALGKISEAKELLEQVEKEAPQTMEGYAYVLLGSLYFQAPAWPISFGNNRKAKEYLTKALAINPTSIDANYYYGELLRDTGDYAESYCYLTKAKNTPPRDSYHRADEARHRRVSKALGKLEKKLKIEAKC